MRLGVAAALVDGALVAGDVDVDADRGAVVEVGLGSGGSGVAVPGLVDLQVNGLADVDFRTCGPDGYRVAAELLAAAGATAVQPTLHSQSLEDHERALAVLGEVHAEPPAGCTFLSAHLEGPFLSRQWAGAHQPEHLLDPDTEVLDRLLAAGPVGFMTVAPELPGGLDLIRRLIERGVTASIGHTDADAAQVRAAIGAGAHHLTHCWNAHRRFTPRDPGPAGVALSDPTIVVGLVADLVHVASEVVSLTLAAAPGRVAATTDLVAGEALAGGVLRRPDGVIGGGVARPDDCLRNLVGLGVELADAVEACGGVQRRLLGLPEVGLRPGDPADVVVLDDSLEVTRTLVRGVECWRA